MASSLAITSIIPLLVVIIVVIIIAVIVSREQRKSLLKSKYPSTMYQGTTPRYVPGMFSPQMELDMRLPYRRFRQLYPYSTWTYEDYKRMQMQTAFRRSTSSQQNKRMVR